MLDKFSAERGISLQKPKTTQEKIMAKILNKDNKGIVGLIPPEHKLPAVALLAIETVFTTVVVSGSENVQRE